MPVNWQDDSGAALPEAEVIALFEQAEGPRQLACEARNGHCFHAFSDLTRAFEECCVCALRRNERVVAEQIGLL